MATVWPTQRYPTTPEKVITTESFMTVAEAEILTRKSGEFGVSSRRGTTAGGPGPGTERVDLECFGPIRRGHGMPHCCRELGAADGERTVRPARDLSSRVVRLALIIQRKR